MGIDLSSLASAEHRHKSRHHGGAARWVTSLTRLEDRTVLAKSREEVLRMHRDPVIEQRAFP